MSKSLMSNSGLIECKVYKLSPSKHFQYYIKLDNQEVLFGTENTEQEAKDKVTDFLQYLKEEIDSLETSNIRL